MTFDPDLDTTPQYQRNFSGYGGVTSIGGMLMNWATGGRRRMSMADVDALRLHEQKLKLNTTYDVAGHTMKTEKETEEEGKRKDQNVASALELRSRGESDMLDSYHKNLQKYAALAEEDPAAAHIYKGLLNFREKHMGGVNAASVTASGASLGANLSSVSFNIGGSDKDNKSATPGFGDTGPRP